MNKGVLGTLALAGAAVFAWSVATSGHSEAG